MNKLDVKDVRKMKSHIVSARDLADIFVSLANNVIATHNAIRNTAYVFQANKQAFDQLRDILNAPGFCRCSTQLLVRNGCQCNGI